MTDVDDAIERAEARPTMRNPSDYARDCRILAAEVKRVRRFIPPDGWVQFGTHANCGRRVPLEFSEDVGEDGLPLWERPVSEWDTEDEVCPHCLNDPPAHHVCPRCLRRSAP